MKIQLIIPCLLLLFINSLFAATVTWTGTGDAVSWSDPANWSGNAVPSSSDLAMIGPGFSTNLNPIIVAGNENIESLELDNANIKINSGASIDVISTSSYTFASVNISNGSNIELIGTLNIYGSVFADNSGLDVKSGGYLSLDGSHPNVNFNLWASGNTYINNVGTIICLNNQKSNGDPQQVCLLLDNNTTLWNDGVVQIWEAGQKPPVIGIMVDDGSTIYNRPTGELWIDIALQNAITITGSSSSALSGITNEGVIQTSQCTSCPVNGNPDPSGAAVYIGSYGCYNGQPSGVIQSSPGYPAWPQQINDTSGPTSNCVNVLSLVVPPAPPSSVFNPGSFTLGLSSVLSGSGAINNSSLVIQGTVSPGFSPGIITFTENYVGNSATFNMEIAGSAGPGLATGFDQIVFQGSNNSITGNTLNVNFLDGFVPSVGDQFVLFSGPVSDNFSTISLPGDDSSYNLIYNSNEIILEILHPINNVYNMGVGTSNPKAKLHINEGDVFVETIGSGVILQSSPGNCYKITVDETTGNVIATSLPCPN